VRRGLAQRAGLQLQKQLGLGSYKSACAKLRRAMVAPGRAPLAGLIEVDETPATLGCQSTRCEMARQRLTWLTGQIVWSWL